MTTALEIVQILPRLPPSISGVGDYAYLLARELRATREIHTHFIVCDPFWEGAGHLDGFTVNRVNDRRPHELMKQISHCEMPAALVLQYVGYGYQKRGCPVWLVKALDE